MVLMVSTKVKPVICDNSRHCNFPHRRPVKTVSALEYPMFRLISALLAVPLLATNFASAADVSGYLVGTTDYVYRGVSQSDGHAALQGGLDVGFDSGVFFGAWASTVDITTPVDHERQHELRVYAGYGFDLNDELRLVLNTVAYRYPGADGNVDYENHETSVSLGVLDQYWIEYAYSPNLYNTGRDTHNIELFSEWMVGDAYSVSAGVGHFRIDRPVSNIASDSLYWQLGVTRSFSRIDVDVRYHDSEEAVWFTSTADQIGSRFVLSIRLGF